MPKTTGQDASPHTALGQWKAGNRPSTRVETMSIPEGCLCAWDMHGAKNEGGFYTGLYWFTLKYRYTGCEAFRQGLHK